MADSRQAAEPSVQIYERIVDRPKYQVVLYYEPDTGYLQIEKLNRSGMADPWETTIIRIPPFGVRNMIRFMSKLPPIPEEVLKELPNKSDHLM